MLQNSTAVILKGIHFYLLASWTLESRDMADVTKLYLLIKKVFADEAIITALY